MMRPTQRGIRGATTVLLAAVLVLSGCGNDSGDEEVFCTAEAMLYPDGESYGRSGSRGCQFVESDGSLLEVTADGEPLCYDGRYEGADGQSVMPLIVDCDEPGALPPQ